jgi:foldase protein PrsA
MVTRIRAMAALTLAATPLAVTGCGGGVSTTAHAARTQTRIPIAADARPEPGGTNQSGGVVAWVGHTPVARSALESRIAIEVHSEESSGAVPVPPAFSACVAQLAAGASDAESSATQLRGRCRQRYQTLLGKVLGSLIAADRVIDQAAAEGVGPTNQQVRRRVEYLKASQFGSEAGFKAFLARSGENVPDLLFNIEEQMANAAVFSRLRDATAHVTPAIVASYYADHRREYAVAEQRDLGIVRTKSAAVARRIKRALETGASFEGVRAGLSDAQPVGAEHGLVDGLEPHYYAERRLNDAIFAAPVREVRGPVRLAIFPPSTRFPTASGDIQDVDGYYVFEVFRIHRAYVKQLAQVDAELKRALPGIRFKKAVRAYVRAYRTRWLARTNCAEAYVVRKCRQFRRKHSEAPEDPYTLS